MTDAEFDSIAMRAFPSIDLPSERVWKQTVSSGKWTWLPSPGESVMAACVASVLVGGFVAVEKGRAEFKSHIKIDAPSPFRPFEASFLAVSQLSGIDLSPEPDTAVEKRRVKND